MARKFLCSTGPYAVNEASTIWLWAKNKRLMGAPNQIPLIYLNLRFKK